MKTCTYVNFDGNDVPGGAQAILGPANCGPDVATVENVPVLRQMVVWVVLEDTDERLPQLLSLLRHHGVGWLEQHRDVYTDDEIADARLLVMKPNRTSEVDGGPEWGTDYDLSSACPICGTGARQTSALLINGEHLPALTGSRASFTYFWHILVDERLAQALEDSGVTGLSFHNVYAVMPDKRQVKLRWKQILAERALPPMSNRTTGLVRERGCERCKRNGYATTLKQPTRIVYRTKDLEGMVDVNATWEWTGPGRLLPDLRESLIARPWMLVTPKVWRIFRDAGVTEFDWIPIRVVED